jgi:hypothetical protein
MRLHISLGLLSLILAAAAIAPSASDAAITTIGSQTLTTGMENSMSLGTFIEYSLPGPAAEYVSPIDGTIVTWRIDSGSTAPVKLRVLRPAGGGKFTGVGTSALEMASGDAIDTFATSLPIKAGDIIGLDNESQALIFAKGVMGAFPRVFTPALADGAPAAEPTEVLGSGSDLKLQINADIQPTPTTGGGGGAGGGGTGGNGGGGGSGQPPAPPTLGRLKVVPNALKKRTGGTVSYTDSQPATTTFTVLLKEPGRRNRQGVCAKPARKPQGGRCTRVVKIASFTHLDSAGANSFPLSGQLNGRRLKPGSYELQAIARNSGGLASGPVAVGFSVHS